MLNIVVAQQSKWSQNSPYTIPCKSTTCFPSKYVLVIKQLKSAKPEMWGAMRKSIPWSSRAINYTPFIVGASILSVYIQELIFRIAGKIIFMLFKTPSFKNGKYDVECECDECLMKLRDLAGCRYYQRLTIPLKGLLTRIPTANIDWVWCFSPHKMY